MILFTNNNTSNIINCETYSDELFKFQNFCNTYKALADERAASPNFHCEYRRYDHTMVYREVGLIGGVNETLITVTIAYTGNFLKRVWQEYDRDIANSQGGTTKFKGWSLELP